MSLKINDVYLEPLSAVRAAGRTHTEKKRGGVDGGKKKDHHTLRKSLIIIITRRMWSLRRYCVVHSSVLISFPFPLSRFSHTFGFEASQFLFKSKSRARVYTISIWREFRINWSSLEILLNLKARTNLVHYCDSFYK